MWLFLVALALPLAAGLLALVFSRQPRVATILGAGGAALGGAIGLIPTAQTLLGRAPAPIRWPWHVPYGEFHVAIDPLSAIFLLIIFSLGGLVAVYGGPYLLAYRERKNLGAPWLFYNWLLTSMALLVASRNAILFLMAWEFMAVTSFFLVTFEHEKAEARNAGWTYLVAAHLGAAFLLAMFALLGSEAGSMDFDAFAAQPLAAGVIASGVFLLALVGFGSKAGFAPLHVWLPEAHPAAPSHVSALLSGVMIKLGIYGILRALTFMAEPAAWQGMALVAIGLTSGLLGVVFALAQRDLKRMLAYSSVENIGIIALGLGVGVWGRSQGHEGLALLGFAGAMLHTVNHAAFKGLLFLAAGSVLHGAGERNMERLGGLLRRMPFTMLAFMIGAAAITGLPLLNGFIGEFLLLLAAFQGMAEANAAQAALLTSVAAGLGLMGGLALALFTRAFGVVFLGEPRSHSAQYAHEGGWGFRLPLLALMAVCLGAGLLAPLAARAVLPAASQMAGVSLDAAIAQVGAFTAPLGRVMLAGWLLAGFIGGLAALRWLLLRKRQPATSVTWDCGYEQPSARMQYTASSFAQPLVAVFRSVLQTRQHLHPPHGYFPSAGAFHSETPDLFTNWVYRPAAALAVWAGDRLRWLQQGRVHLYLLYIFITLVILLVWRLGW